MSKKQQRKDNEIHLEPAAIGGYLGGVLISAYANKLTFRQLIQGQILGLIGGYIGQQIGALTGPGIFTETSQTTHKP